MTTEINNIDGETSITEITFQPDGRVYVFGTSRELLEILEPLQPYDKKLSCLLSIARSASRQQTESEL